MLHVCLPSTSLISVALYFTNLKVFSLASQIRSTTTHVRLLHSLLLLGEVFARLGAQRGGFEGQDQGPGGLRTVR